LIWVERLEVRVLAVAIALTAAEQASAAGEETDSAKPAAPERSFSRGLVELKRQATSRGTPEETTKTNLKFDYFPEEGIVALLRLELPFPDEKSTFEGSPFDPDFGDAKTRVGFRAIEVLGRPTTSFVELTFPTADPESQGTGKYQISAGAKPTFALSPGPSWLGSPRQAFSVQIQQVVSFAGDADRKDINQTKFELEWRDTWAGGHYGKVTAKPVVDWVGDGETGAVLEVEGGWVVDRRWTLALMAGGLLWGDGVPGTYNTRVELKAIWRY
jgi:hypothetical protein